MIPTEMFFYGSVVGTPEDVLRSFDEHFRSVHDATGVHYNFVQL